MDGSGLNWFSSCHQIIFFFLCQLVLNSCYLPWYASGVCFCSHAITITFYPEISLKNFPELQPWPEAFGSTFHTPRSGGPPWICSPPLLSRVSRIYHEHIHVWCQDPVSFGSCYHCQLKKSFSWCLQCKLFCLCCWPGLRFLYLLSVFCHVVDAYIQENFKIDHTVLLMLILLCQPQNLLNILNPHSKDKL